MKSASLKLVLTGIMICLTVLTFVLVGSCGKGRTPAPSIDLEPAVKTGQSVLNRRNIPPLEELLAELDALEKPSQADPQVWVKLKTDMREWLMATFGDSKGVSKYPYRDPEKPDPGPPTHDYVKPRDLCWASSGALGKLTWIYVNDGDYDEDGKVSIADITPLAIYYDQEVVYDNSIQELIDEDDELRQDLG
ncbi:hypothetical protein J7J84_00345 [bacterium]|nr:hypothetical protein [bacterium]